MFITKVLQEPNEGLLTLPFNPEKDRSTGLDSCEAAIHRPSTESRNATQNTRSVLGVESDIPAESLHVLSTMQSSRTVVRLLEYEDLFFLQVVK